MPGKSNYSTGNLGIDTICYLASVTFPTLAANASSTTTLTVPGAQALDCCSCSMQAPPAHLFLDNAYVSAPGVVTFTWSSDGTGISTATVNILLNISRVDGANLGSSAIATNLT